MIAVDTLIALVLFAFVASATPGPNNMMLLASGVNFGFRRTMPHMLGVGFGFVFMVMMIGLGLGGLFQSLPILQDILKIAGAVYMVWLAWKLGTTKSISDGSARARPMTFLGAAAFQWVNPKAWAMALSATATYTAVPGFFALNILVVAGVFGLINLPTISCWALFGVWLRRLLAAPRIVRWFNIVMALLLIASLWPVFAEFGAR